MTTLSLGALDMIGIIAVPKNGVKGLRQFGIVWLHLQQYQRVDVRTVFIIPLSYILGYTNVDDYKKLERLMK